MKNKITVMIVAVDSAANTITVTTPADQQITLVTDYQTRIQSGGIITSPASLIIGSQITVEYDVTTNTATAIVVQ